MKGGFWYEDATALNEETTLLTLFKFSVKWQVLQLPVYALAL